MIPACPFAVVPITDPRIGGLYKSRLVLVRPDGHAAWRGDVMPDDPLAVALINDPSS